jgi:hypothetical protein
MHPVSEFFITANMRFIVTQPILKECGVQNTKRRWHPIFRHTTPLFYRALLFISLILSAFYALLSFWADSKLRRLNRCLMSLEDGMKADATNRKQLGEGAFILMSSPLGRRYVLPGDGPEWRRQETERKSKDKGAIDVWRSEGERPLSHAVLRRWIIEWSLTRL